MTWIKIITVHKTIRRSREARQMQQDLYPAEYGNPAIPSPGGESIVASHSLIPDALYHAFAAYGVAAVAGPSAIAPAARDDRHRRLGDQPLFLLSGIARRVSASRLAG